MVKNQLTNSDLTHIGVFLKSILHPFLFVPLFFCLALVSVFSSGCSEGQKGFDSASDGELSGYIAVSTVTADSATGPGMVTLFKPDGTFHKVIRDLYDSTANWAGGIGFQSPDSIILAIEGASSDRIERVPISDPSLFQTVASGFIGATQLRSMVQTTHGDFYIIENTGNSSSIERVNSNFARAGGPWIPTTVGSCPLGNIGAYGVAYDPNTERIFVTGTSGRLNIYNDNDGSCVTSLNGAPFSGNSPTGIVYHPQTDKILVVLSGAHSIRACDTSGANCSDVFTSASVLSTPRAIAVDTDGYIYVSSSGNDSVLKLEWTGSGYATVVSAPLISPSVYSQNIQAILVIP